MCIVHTYQYISVGKLRSDSRYATNEQSPAKNFDAAILKRGVEFNPFLRVEKLTIMGALASAAGGRSLTIVSYTTVAAATRGRITPVVVTAVITTATGRVTSVPMATRRPRSASLAVRGSRGVIVGISIT